MSDFQLNPDEYEVMRSEQVRYGGTMANYTSDLVLTNQHIILVRRGVFGGAKKAEYFPLRRVKVVDDRPQAIARGDKLEIHFVDGYEEFWFHRKRDVRVWADNLAGLLLGDDDDLRSMDGKALPGADLIAEAAKDTLDALKRPFRKTSRPEKVTRSCPSCAASVSGVAGRVVRCPSCGLEQKLPSDTP